MNTKQPRYKNHPKNLLEVLAFVALATWTAPALSAQTTDPKKEEDAKEEKVLELSPFEVVGTKDTGYAASSSLAGSRLNTRLKDVASAISVVTPEFMKDTGSTNLQQILVYTTNTEVAGIGGNYYGGNADDGNL